MTVTSDFIACCTRCHPITSPAFSPACLPLARSASATQPSLLFRARHSPASGPLHRLFPLPGTLCHQYLRGSSLVTLFRYFLCCHRLSDRRPRFGKLSLLRQPAALLRVPVYHVHDLPRGNVSPMGQGFCSGLFTPAPPVPKMAPGMQCLLSE